MKQSRSPATGRRKQVADSDARAQLLDTAVLLFAERGIANTTVAQIAAAGNVMSAMIHYWFDSRERLLDAVVEERLAPQFHVVWDRAAVETDTPEQMIEGI